jgi:hypothetical protein
MRMKIATYGMVADLNRVRSLDTALQAKHQVHEWYQTGAKVGNM